MSLVTSKATASASRRSVPGASTVVSSCPATTCAFVTTRPGAATQPEPAIVRPHAVPDTRTTLDAAARTPGARKTCGLGGSTGASGPAMAGNGSTRASARSAREGGAISFSRWSTSERCASRRSCV